MLYSEVERRFNATLKSKLGVKKPEVLKWLMQHERKQVMINNLCGQIIKIEQSNIRVVFDVKRFDYLIKEMAKFWASTVLEHKRQEMLSSVEKLRLISEADAIKEFERISDEDQEILKQPKDYEHERT